MECRLVACVAKMTMHGLAIATAFVGGSLFLSVQWPLLWPRTSLRIALTVLSIVIVFVPGFIDDPMWFAGSSVIVGGLYLATVQRWSNQVWLDGLWRDSDEVPKPIRGSSGQTAWNLIYIVRYRHLMFRDQYSRDLIIAQANRFPFLRMTVPEEHHRRLRKTMKIVYAMDAKSGQSTGLSNTPPKPDPRPLSQRSELLVGERHE